MRTLRSSVSGTGRRPAATNVPETKIRERNRRLWALVADAIALSDIATVYDNSSLRGPRIIAQLSGGDIVGRPDCPAHTPEARRSRWPN
jgi:predicted ABC-type ATPase